MIGLATDLDAYRAAAAELSVSVRLRCTQPADLAVVPGAVGWPEAVHRAIDTGARAVVVDAPRANARDLDEVAFLVAGSTPVLLSRPGLRDDDARDAASPAPPAAVTVQLHAPRGLLAGALVDAVGWARVLAGGALALRAASGDGVTALADLDRHACGVALIGSERLDARGRPRLRATTISPERVDVVADGSVAVVTRATAAGELALPRRWEAPARLALRRAITAIETGAAPTDLADWRDDATLAARISAAR